MTNQLLPGTLRSAADLLQKLRRDAALLEQEVTSDRLFNFVVTGYSLIDWVRHDPNVPATAKAERNTLYQHQWLILCGDLATAAKHFELTTRSPTASKVTAVQGYGLGGFGKGPYGVGEEQIEIHLPNGTVHSLSELTNGVLNTWTDFFKRHKIPGA